LPNSLGVFCIVVATFMGLIIADESANYNLRSEAGRSHPPGKTR